MVPIETYATWSGEKGELCINDRMDCSMPVEMSTPVVVLLDAMTLSVPLRVGSSSTASVFVPVHKVTQCTQESEDV